MKQFFQNINKPSEKAIIITLVLLCFITRIPQLISVNRILDGDECVVAMMAKHIYQGKNFPLFFIGQKYGLTIFESLSIVPFIALFGMHTIPVKLAMLCLWTVGVVFFYKTLVQVNKKNAWLPFLLTLVLIFTPAWAVWSMKARGGYITAFTFSSIAMYLLFNNKLHKRNILYASLGILLVLIYESQPLWLPGVLPFYFYRLVKDRNWKRSLLLFSVAAVLVIAFRFYQQGLPDFYLAPQPYFAPEEKRHWILTRIPEFLYASLHGYYFFNLFQVPNVFCGIQAVLFSALVFIMLPVAIIFLFRKKINWVLMLSVLGIVLMLVMTMFTYLMIARYLLPITVITLFSFAILLNEIKARKWLLYISCLFVLLGVPGMISFYNFEFCDVKEQELTEALDVLHKDGIDYIFCPEDFLTWQVNFYSNEKIAARAVYMPGRYPPYNTGVNNALYQHRKTAVFNTNTYNNEYKWEFDSIRIVGHYYVCVYPKYETLKKKFQF